MTFFIHSAYQLNTLKYFSQYHTNNIAMRIIETVILSSKWFYHDSIS